MNTELFHDPQKHFEYLILYERIFSYAFLSKCTTEDFSVAALLDGMMSLSDSPKKRSGEKIKDLYEKDIGDFSKIPISKEI